MHFFGKNIGILVIYLNQSNTNTVTHVFVAFIKLNVSLEIQYVSFSHPEAEFKEFERFKLKPRFKYGWFT